MPSTKLRSASSLLAERHRDEEDSQPQDESFHAPPHSAPNSVDGPDFDLDDDDEEEEEEGGGGGGRGEGVSIQSDSDDSDDDDTSDEDDQEVGFDAEHAALVPHQASPAGDAPMVDAPSSGHSTPWFDHLHSLNISHSPGLTFGLQLATPSSSSSSSSSNSSHDTSDHEMSDNDGGGASLSDPAVGEGNHQVNVAAQTAQSHHNDATEIQQDGPPGNLIVPGMQPGSFILGNNGNSVVAGPAMLFGFAQGGIQIQPPGPWNGPNNPPTFFETSPAPAAPAHLPPAGPNEDDLQPLMPSSTNSMILGSENVGLVDFLRFWAHRGAPGNARTLVPDIREIHAQANANVKQVTYDDLHGDHCDMQGLDWAGMGTTRAAARTKRHLSYKNYVNKEGSDCWTVSGPVNMHQQPHFF